MFRGFESGRGLEVGERRAGREPEADLRRGVVDPDRRVHERHDRLGTSGFRAGDDPGQGVAVIPVVQLEPQRECRLGGRDVLDARRGVDRDDEQGACPRGTVGHGQLAVRMDRLLEADGPDDDGRRHRRAEQRRLGPDRRDVDEDARSKAATTECSLVIPGEIGPGPGSDPFVDGRVEHMPGDVAEDPGIESVDEGLGHRGSRQQCIRSPRVTDRMDEGRRPV